MPTLTRRTFLAAVLLAVAALLPTGCQSPTPTQSVDRPGTPQVRVRLLGGATSVTIAPASADAPPPGVAGITPALYDPAAAADLPPDAGDTPVRPIVGMPTTGATLRRSGGAWRLNGVPVGGVGGLAVLPAADGSVLLNGKAYRGAYWCLPAAGDTFDVVNVLGVDAYLKGVIAEELFKDWHPQAYRAQAVAARTYALHQIASRPADRRGRFDVYADTRSQAYGGLAGETAKSVEAVDATAGLVLAHGPAGDEKVFPAYYSACCGGVVAAGSDVFDLPPTPPLSAQSVGDLCAASPTFRWPAVRLTKADLANRLRKFGPNMGKMAAIERVEVESANRFGRPVRYAVTDARGDRYPIDADRFRTAVNRGAPGRTLPSGWFAPQTDAAGVTFADGRGFGHGVGLCQYCTQARAAGGMRYEDVLARAYPRSVLVRAY